MEIFSLKFITLIHFQFHLLLFTLFCCNLRATSAQLIPNGPLQDVVCALINCGEGTCKASNASTLIGFDCECNLGWKKMQIGPLTFPSCVVPNCVNEDDCDKMKCGCKLPNFVVMGHRGSGMNNILQSLDHVKKSIRENSILSFNATAKFPIDFIKFDVQREVVEGNEAGRRWRVWETTSETRLSRSTMVEVVRDGDCECGVVRDCNSLGFGPAPTPSASPRSTGPPGLNGGSSEAPICLRSLHALTTIMLALIFLCWT